MLAVSGSTIFLAITEVDIKLVSEYCFKYSKTSMIEFRTSFAKEMIHNIHLQQEQKGKDG